MYLVQDEDVGEAMHLESRVINGDLQESGPRSYGAVSTAAAHTTAVSQKQLQ